MYDRFFNSGEPVKKAGVKSDKCKIFREEKNDVRGSCGGPSVQKPISLTITKGLKAEQTKLFH